MAISTVDQLIAGTLPSVSFLKAAFTGEAAGERFCPVFTAGNPGAASAPTGINGSALTSLTGAIPVPAAVSGDYIELTEFMATQGGSVGGAWLVDLLWWNGSVSIATTIGQAITHPGLPSRDRSASANGDGIFAALLVSSTTGNGAPVTNTTITYTNSSGTGSKTGTVTSFPATAVAGTWVPINLAAGDTGVRSIQALTLGTSYVSGTVHVVQYRPIAYVPLATDNRGDRALPGIRRVWDNSCLALVYDLTGTTGGVTSGMLGFAQG